MRKRTGRCRCHTTSRYRARSAINGSRTNWVAGIEDYLTWNAGISYTWRDTVTLDLRYYDTDRSGFDDEAVVASVSVNSSLSSLRILFAR